MADDTRHQVNLLDLLAFLLRWRRFLVVAVLTVSLVVAIISFLVTPRYRSTAIVRVAESSNAGLGGLIASKLSSLGGIGGLLPTFSDIPGEVFVTILKSRWMFERLIEEFDLRTVYDMEETPIEDVIEMAESRTKVELEPESQSILIFAEDESAERAQAMAQFIVDELDKRYQELKSTNARREREYIGERLVETQSSLAALEDSMAQFQIQTGILDPEEQVKATISAAATLEAERLAAQIELEMTQQVYGSGLEPGLLRFRLASIDSALRRLCQSKSTNDEDWDFILHLRDVPQQAVTYLRLRRDIEIQQILAAILIQQHEQAKLEERRNTPTLMRVDPPVVPDKKSWPRRGLMVGMAAIATLVFASAIGMITEFFSLAARDPNHGQHDKVASIQSSWRRKRRA